MCAGLYQNGPFSGVSRPEGSRTTCITGVAKGGTVWIGGDSAANGEQGVLTYKQPKVFRRGGLLIGVSHSFRMRDLLHHAFVVPRRKRGQSDDQYLVTTVIDQIRFTFFEASFDHEAEQADASGDGAFMVGYHGRLFTVDWDLHLGEVKEGHDAIGSGGPYALGNLFETARLDCAPRERVRRALEAAAHCSHTVRPPFRILSVR